MRSIIDKSYVTFSWSIKVPGLDVDQNCLFLGALAPQDSTKSQTTDNKQTDT